MKKVTKTVFCGIMAALAVAALLTAYFPYFTYAAPALASLALAAVNIEFSKSWALGTYIASGLIALIVCEKESALLYVCFFGYYIILKGVIEQHFHGVIEYILKYLCFNASVILLYELIIKVLGIPLTESGEGGLLFSILLLLLGNVVFLVYDIALTRVIGVYMARLHPKVYKILKR